MTACLFHICLHDYAACAVRVNGFQVGCSRWGHMVVSRGQFSVALEYSVATCPWAQCAYSLALSYKTATQWHQILDLQLMRSVIEGTMTV